jgi:hypothetical protein
VLIRNFRPEMEARIKTYKADAQIARAAAE